MGVRRRLSVAWRRLLPGVPLPIRTSPGLWWIARGDSIDAQLVEGVFEVADRALVLDLLRPGMTVLDIGANAGIYTMTAATRVGAAGRVIAFEPSGRERHRLARHLALNRLTNVHVEVCALGASDGETELFIAGDLEAGFNSRVAMPGIAMQRQRVAMCRLDTYAARAGLERVDFIKIDVEGGERDVLAGGEQLLRRARPMLLVEIEPARIAPWGYPPKAIYDLVAGWGYEWSAMTDEGLQPLATAPAEFTGNYFARPR
jgi:FkbM family methyltransferase